MELVTGAMGSLLSKLGELLKEEYKLYKGVRAQVESLKSELETMYAALRRVAEVPHEQLDELVKLWARDIRELSYDMEDIVDTFMVRVEDGGEATPNPNILQWLIEKMVDFCSKGKARHQIANAIKGINNQLQDVTNRHGRYTVNNIVATSAATSTNIVATSAATSTTDRRLLAMYKDAAQLVGIDDSRDMLIEMLFNKKMKIVSIVGLGGLGKTTLAKAVHDKIKTGFACQAFVPVGQNPDMKKVFRDILIGLNKEKYTNLNMMLDEKQLIDELREFLENKRYLVVIDDIWAISVWTMIKCGLPDNNLENRIIATTRHHDVAKQIGHPYNLQPLSDANSEKLFYGRIFGGECPDNQLREVSNNILRKCGGVPLAIVTIASLLNSIMKNKRECDMVHEWNKVHESIGCGLLKGSDIEDMRLILSLSYYSLPPHLRNCLVYMSIFPEDHKIKKDHLLWLWIAEGFIQYGEQGETLYELGEYYFNELINRSLIQPGDIAFDGRVEACRVHDMVLDLIRSLSKEENFVTVLDGDEQNTSSQRTVRRLSIQNTSKVTASLDSMTMPQKLRSLAVFSSPANLELPLSRFCSLRVLELEGCDVQEELHLNLENFLYLRYLRVNKHTSLPDGMGSLASLEVLSGVFLNNSPDRVKELRKLTGLRKLEIMLDIDRTVGDSLQVDLAESLCNLPKIHTLVIHAIQGCLDRFGERWVPPQGLVYFLFIGPGFFSRMPACIERNLTNLSDLSSLTIQVKQLRQEDMQILARLPALCSLWIWGATRERLIIGADGFRCLRNFTCWHGTPMFQQGAMPRVESVFFTLHVRKTKEDVNYGFETGLGNLRSLQDVEVYLQRGGARAGEVEEAEAALKHAADVNPNKPTLKITRFGGRDSNTSEEVQSHPSNLEIWLE